MDHINDNFLKAKDIQVSSFSPKTAEKMEWEYVNNKGMKYCISFGDDVNFPNCECHDWQRNMWPCKHVLLITQLHDSLGGLVKCVHSITILELRQ